MADNAAAANGFALRHLHKNEAWMLYQAGYPAPPDMRVPGASAGQGSWHLSAGGMPVPPVPEGAEREYAIEQVLAGLTPEQAADPRWQAHHNDAFWTEYFRRREEHELADTGRNGPVEGRCNSRGRKRWWGGEGRTLEFVLDHIAAGNEPCLTMPPRRSWLPRRMGGSTSSFSSSGAHSAPPSVTPPCLNSGWRVPTRSTLRINERRPASPPRSLFRRLVKPKTEGKKKAVEWEAPPDYLRAAATMGELEEEFPGQRLAMEASFNEVLPAPDDVAEKWSLKMHAEEEVERQRQILERAAPTGGRRIPPPPPPPEYYILNPSDEDEDAPTAPGPSRWHGDEDVAGPSKAPGDGSDDDGDYIQAIYSQMGIM